MRIVIVGAGFSGLAAAKELQNHGHHDYVILEKGNGVGGVWRENHYPGAACDIPSYMYSFSWATRRDWSQPCSSQAEIERYLRRSRMTTACWSTADSVWRSQLPPGMSSPAPGR